MNTFRVGQRVRLVAHHPDGKHSVPIGTCGVIEDTHIISVNRYMQLVESEYLVDFGVKTNGIDGWQLEPILDDKDAREHFADLMRKIDLGVDVVANVR